jgi:hypothetical protein
MEHLYSLRNFYLQKHKQQTKAIIKNTNTTAIIIIRRRKTPLRGTWWLVCLFVACAWFVTEEAVKEKKTKEDNVRNLWEKTNYNLLFPKPDKPGLLPVILHCPCIQIAS